jgi:hypothetical protein
VRQFLLRGWPRGRREGLSAVICKGRGQRRRETKEAAVGKPSTAVHLQIRRHPVFLEAAPEGKVYLSYFSEVMKLFTNQQCWDAMEPHFVVLATPDAELVYMHAYSVV